ncbi:MAG: T9SS type A sorting domain-containing protein [candidate division WOR-3 bacterium]|nr:T9SS type A sorting domain-containing protein [candidate division WOR-3 bacterium]
MKYIEVLFCCCVILVPHFIFSQTERWVYKYSGLSGWQNEACNAICYGSDGNIYAAGTGCHAGTDIDIVVVSLSTSGAERWVYVHNGYADFIDDANTITCDANNYVYVGGSSYNSDTISDFTVISLTPDGSERWIYRHQGPYIGDGCVRALAYGADGNIYAAGYDERFQSGRDFIIVSLDTSGTERWVYRYNGPGNNTDDAYSIVCGSDGNVYAAGSYDYNHAVVLSVTADGTERWVYQYGQHYEDGANAVVYGADGNVYAFGTCAVNTGYVYAFLFTIKLSDSGYEHWTYVNSVPSSATCGIFGDDGNIYCAGSYGSDMPVFTVLGISSAGLFMWEYMHGLSVSWATSIIYAPDNKIYAAGCGVDSVMGVHLAVVSLYTSGTQRWTYDYGGPDFCIANALCFGADSNLYVGGETVDSVTGTDFTVISLNPIPIMIYDFASQQLSSVLQIYPNPFRHYAEIRCQLPGVNTTSDIDIFDITGQQVTSISVPVSDIGHQSTVKWGGTDDRGMRLPAGVYFVHVKTGAFLGIQKVVKLE